MITMSRSVAPIRDLLRAQQGLAPAGEQDTGRHAHTGEFRRPIP